MEANVSLGSRPASPIAADGIAPGGTRKALVIGVSLGGLLMRCPLPWRWRMHRILMRR